MTTAEIVCGIALALITGLLGGYFWGVREGERLGRDKEWLYSFFRAIDQDKLKRDRLGRFKEKTK